MNDEPTFRPMEREETLAERVYGRLRAALVGGRLPPGHRLVHRHLAAEMNVSPTPVRDALLRLVSEGALELDARGIPWVPRPPPERYAEIMELRIELEGRAAAAAATLRTPAEIRELWEIHRRLMQARRDADAERLLAENESFHFGVVAIARMPVLRRIVEHLWTQSGPAVHLLAHANRAGFAEGHPHEDLLRALEASDPGAARAAVERDLREYTRIIIPLLEQDGRRHASMP